MCGVVFDVCWRRGALLLASGAWDTGAALGDDFVYFLVDYNHMHQRNQLRRLPRLTALLISIGTKTRSPRHQACTPPPQVLSKLASLPPLPPLPHPQSPSPHRSPRKQRTPLQRQLGKMPSHHRPRPKPQILPRPRPAHSPLITKRHLIQPITNIRMHIIHKHLPRRVPRPRARCACEVHPVRLPVRDV